MIKQITRGLTQTLRQVHLDLANFKETVFLAGTGRSGTTWVEEIINSSGSYRVMFEPFHSKKIPRLSGWNYRQYLRCENQEEKFLGPATDILSGRIRDKWIDQFNGTVFSKKRLIKDIRANLFLKWIKHNFPEISVILLLRHPCAVANSKLKLGWSTHLKDYLEQDELMADFLEPFQSHIAEAEGRSDNFEKHIFLWCIENYIPLRQFRQNEIFVSFYEDLCSNPQKEIQEILAFIGEEKLARPHDVAGRPSALARKGSAINSRSSLIDAWRNDISQKQVDRAIEILRLFSLDKIYGYKSLPLLNGNEALNEF